MEALWDAKNGPVESSPSNFIRQLLQSTSNPVDTEPFSADWKNAVGICLAFVVSGLANSVGISGLFWVPLFNALLGFSVNAAAAMSQALVATGTLGASMYSILLRHPSTYSKPLIDYSLSALLMPSLVLGVSIGVLLNIITPLLIVSIVLFLILVLVAARTLQKGIQQKRSERANASEYASNGNSNDSTDSNGEGRTRKWSFASFRKWAGVDHRPIIEWNYVIELLIIGGILLGFQIGKAEFNRCTWQYGVLFGVQVLLVAAVTIGSVVMHNKKKQKQSVPVNTEKKEESPVASVPSMVSENGNGNSNGNDYAIASTSTTISPAIPTLITSDNSSNNDSNRSNDIVEEKEQNDEDSSKAWPVRRLLHIFIFVIFIGMIAGMVGLGGGVLIAPLMMELGVHPQSATSTANFIILFSSTIATVTFILFGKINLSYFAVYGPVCFIGGLVGVFILSNLVRRYNMASLITLLLAVLVIISAGIVAGFAIRDAAEDVVDTGSIEAAADFCAD